MIVEIKQNEYNLKDNIENIKDFNYLNFNDYKWISVAKILTSKFPKEYNRLPFNIEIHPTKRNPIVKMFFNGVNNEELICIKLTPYEVSISTNGSLKYSRILTHKWQDILIKEFGEHYETAKNKHYGIKVEAK